MRVLDEMIAEELDNIRKTLREKGLLGYLEEISS
jgi:hypothetical protein